MVPRDAFINVLRRELNYKHKRQTDRTNMFRQRGTGHPVIIKRSAAAFSPEYVRKILCDSGMDDERIERILAEIDGE